MKTVLTVLLLTAITAITAQAQVSAPPGSVCTPETYWTAEGPITVVVCR